MTFVPIAIYWSIAIWGLASRKPVLLYLFFATLPFGSMAVVPPALTAGLTFVPTAMTGLLLIIKTFSNSRNLLVAIGAALDFRRLGLLFGFWVVALLITIFMPRVLAGQVMVVPMRGELSSSAPLFPTTQNISQLAYLTISVTMVFVFAQILRTREMRQKVLGALVLASAITVTTGVLDYASQFVPIGFLLEPFRTATYALLVDVELLGGKRVVGLMPEASSFGTICLSLLCLLYFLRRAMLNDRMRDLYTPPLIVALLAFAWMSTSSATYVGLAVFVALAGLEWAMRFLETRYDSMRRRHLGIEFGIVMGVLGGLMLVVLLRPDLVDAISKSIDRIVLQKTGSDSYAERSMWTAVSLQALADSYLLGVGLGATRASNSVVAAVSNVGLFGAIFYFGFIIQCLLRRAAPEDREGKVMISGFRYAFFPAFTVGLLVGTTPDFGGFGAFRYGMLTAIGMGGLYAGSMVRSRYRAQQLPPRQPEIA